MKYNICVYYAEHC